MAAMDVFHIILIKKLEEEHLTEVVVAKEEIYSSKLFSPSMIYHISEEGQLKASMESMEDQEEKMVKMEEKQ